MKFLLDTHLLLWAAGSPEKLSQQAISIIEETENELFFSAASLWEISIKNGLGRPDFKVDARVLRRALIDNGYQELSITGLHTISIADLPVIHKDPFDRILLSQATVEGVTLLTSDKTIAQYTGPIQLV
jgi:PIN domain nuclease of toxin-antitoxin system